MNLFYFILISIIIKLVICKDIGIENDDGLRIVSLTNSSYEKPMRCAVCSSLKIEDIKSKKLTTAQKKINAVGNECINNPTNFIKDCQELSDDLDKEYTGCYKIATQMEYLDEERIVKQEYRVSRFCGYSGKLGCEKISGFGSQRYICFCDKPECNSADKLLPLFTSFIIILSFYIKK